jgi:hypothetical protein
VESIISRQTKFSGISRPKALLVSLITIGLLIYGIITCRPAGSPGGVPGKEENDLQCYRAIIDRMHTGEGYYKAAGAELSGRGYPTTSLFNWRLPLLAKSISTLPNADLARIPAVLLAVATSFLWVSILMANLPSLGWKIFGSLLVIDPIVYSLSGYVFLTHEFWAGTLISLSLAAYAKKWGVVAVASGLAALFIRELALLFVAAMMLIDFKERKRPMVIAWLIGIAVFGVELFYHWLRISEISNHVPVIKVGWIALGGWPFVIGTSQMSSYLISLPAWVGAIILPLILLGFLGWRGSLGLRLGLTVGGYMAAFLFVGFHFNVYWGMIYSSVMLLGLLITPYAIKDLCLSIIKRPNC